MIKAKSLRRGYRLDQLAIFIRNEKALVYAITFSHKFLSCSTAKVKEQRTTGIIFGQRHIASLLAVIPDRVTGRTIRRCNPSAQKLGTRDRQRTISADATVIRPVKQLLRRPELFTRKRNLPSRLFLEGRISAIIAGIAHKYNDGIPIRENSPARDCSIFKVQFLESRTGKGQITDIDLRLTGRTFKTSTEYNTFTIWGNFRMINFYSILDFHNV